MSTKQYFGIIFGVVFLLFINGLIISRLLKNKNTLASVSGIIEKQYQISWYGRSPGKAIVIKLDSKDLEFAIQDNKENAFKYLSNHNVLNKNATIYFDQNAPNQSDYRTFHVYIMTVAGQQILSSGDAKSSYKQGLIIINAGALLFIFLIYISKKVQRRVDKMHPTEIE